MRGLKLYIRHQGETGASSSHPLRMRGLKPKGYCDRHQPLMSHPLRMRGLKLKKEAHQHKWQKSRILYGCVD